MHAGLAIILALHGDAIALFGVLGLGRNGEQGHGGGEGSRQSEIERTAIHVSPPYEDEPLLAHVHVFGGTAGSITDQAKILRLMTPT
jgi:hypothetical protein